ncbi:MAG: multidrug effflux MFS transporter [Bacteriovorax sp.]|jgi:DHA1 family bicyclomycin/chloramphenicol resistance-like MFS transporter
MMDSMNQNAKSPYEKTPFIILLGSLAAFDPLSIDMYLPSFPQIGKSFSVPVSSVELSLSAFFVGLAIGQLIYGPLADIYGRKKPLVVGMMVYFMASIGCAFSPSIEIFILFRVMQALGGCSGMVITRAIVSDLFDKTRAAHIYSMLMLVMGVAPILAPLAGGYLTKFLGWRAIFQVLAILSLISISCTAYFLPETHKPTLQNTKRPHFFSLLKPTLFGYWDLLRDKTFMSYCLSSGFMRAAMFAYIAGSPFVFITLFGVPSENYGWIFGTNAVGIIGASQVNRLVLRRATLENTFKYSMIASGVLAFVLLVNSYFFHSLFAILIPLFLMTTSMGFLFPNSAALGLASQGHRAGVASALLGTLQWSIAFVSSFFVSLFHNDSPMPMTGVIFGSTVLAILSLRLLSNEKNHAR